MKSSLLIAMLVVCLSAPGAGYQFPSSGFSKSPNARWKLVCRSPASDGSDTGHRLLLVSVDGISRELRHFDRHCDTLWSADSSRIAVTDWLGSNLSDVFIYSVTNSQSCISVTDLFPKHAIPPDELRGHCYYEAIKWLDDHRLQIRVSGHTDEASSHSFEYLYLLDLLSQRFKKVTTKTPNKALRL